MMPTRRLFMTLLIPALILAGQQLLLLPGMNCQMFALMSRDATGQVALLDAATTAIERAAIFVHARGAHHRALMWFFGPFVPIDLMVPRAQARQARDLLSAVLLDPPTA